MEKKMELIDREKLLKTIPSEEMVARMAVMSAPTVDAVPVSYIQDRIDQLHKLAEYEFEYNGGYVGATHIAWHELEKILIEWKEERDANQDKTD